MRTYRFAVTGVGAVLALGLIGSGAGAKAPSSGTWTYTDVTPNASNFGECFNTTVPASPADVNSYPVKVTKKSAVLTTTSNNALDWAAQITDSKGNVLVTSDQAIGGSQAENMVMTLRKGTYSVDYCNWSGEPQITVDWTLK